MTGKNTIKNIGFLSTYPPRECGLATFTEDLVTEMDKLPFLRTHVIAVVDEQAKCEKYQVAYKLSQHERLSYILTSLWANDNLDLLIIEHEYGIFGGNSGEYILDLAKGLKIPFIVTTHTVLLEPTEKQRTVLRELGKLSTKVVTMAESSKPILAKVYGIDQTKLVFIPHGVPNIPMESREKLKLQHGLQNKQIISSFGLISPAKGLEYGIEAVAKVAPAQENLMYLILGKTHPCVKEKNGEEYRQSLMNLAQKLGIGKQVRFIDKYLTKEEVIRYLHLSDIYLTPYLSKEQAVSGTLAYAMGCGRVIVSTPYRYAVEMLGGGRGLLADFKDSESIAACIQNVFSDFVHKKDMEHKTMAIGQTMMWPTVANQYAELCLDNLQPIRLVTQKSRSAVFLPQQPVSIGIKK